MSHFETRLYVRATLLGPAPRDLASLGRGTSLAKPSRVISLEHEVLVELLRVNPLLARDLARQLETAIPATDAIHVSESKLTEIVPTDYAADLVLLLGPKDRPDFGLIVEVQLRADEGKRYSWPVYVAALRAKHRCPSCVLVVALEEKVACWARRPIDIGQPASTFVPLVLGPDGVPPVTDVAITRACPELGVLSALVHNDDEATARAAFAGAWHLFAVDEDRGTLYNDIVRRAVSAAVLARLEDESMGLENYQYQSAFALKHTAIGRAEGRAEGKSEAVLEVFEARGLAVPNDVRTRVEECRDLELLEQWLKRAITAASPADIFTE